MKRKQPFWVRLFSPVKLKTQRIYVAGSHPRVRLAAFNVFVGVGSFLVAFLLGSVLMTPGESSAEDVSTLANDASLSVALTPEAMNLAVTPTPGGTLASDELAIQVSTDNTTGYTLTLALAGAETSLNDPASGGEIQSSTADINSPATLSVNTWGWYPDSLANNTGNLFSALPSSSDPYELKKTSAPTSGSGDTTAIGFGVNVDTTLPAGSYTNAIIISATTNYVPQPILDVYPTTGWAGDTITLYSNGGFVNVQSVQIGGTNCTSIDVKSADELTCTLPDKAETDTTSGTDNGYDIQVNVVGGQMENHNFTIRYFNPSTTTSMQEFTGATCGSMSVGDIISLTDSRNGQTYRVKKMQDNKCWMVDNLKYAGEANTDLANIDGTYGLVYNNDSSKYNTVDGTSTQSSTNSDKAFYNNPMSASYCYGTSIQSSYTKCGYLYNWYAATAGTGTYATSTQGTNVSGSICPTGWRLPSAMSDGSTATGNGTSYTAADFPVLNASMNAGSLTSGSTSNYYAGWPFTGSWSGVLSGVRNKGFIFQGLYGDYWSSTAYSSSYAMYLYFGSSGVSPAGGGSNKDGGMAVRCVMDEVPVTKVDITYNANGGYFDSDPSKTTELITYQIGEPNNPEIKIAKTSNISDDGTQSGGHGDNVSDTQTVTIPGASSLRVTVTYQTEGTQYDWLAIYDGSVTPSQSNYADSITGKLGGTTKVEKQVFIIPGDTAQFYFRSDSNTSNYYGYYAIVQEDIAITPSGEVSTPTRPGYDFVGWYTDSAGTTGNEFAVNPSMESGTVYAKWGQNYLDDVTYMQDLTATQCSNSYDGATATLLDKRDNNSYTIAKINGNCWMTQNLRIAGGTTLNSSTSNVASSYTIPTTPLEGSSASYTDGQVQDSGNTTTGYWYNFCAASAGTNCNSSNTTYDICPKGWRLPTKTEFDGINGTNVSAFSPVTGGFYSDGSLGGTSGGFWWSSTVYTSIGQYYLQYFGSSGLSVSGISINNRFGYSVRCIRSS